MAKIIKIDCDGVLRDLLPKMCILYNEHFNENINPENVLEYDLTNTFKKCIEIENMTPNKWFFDKHVFEIYVESNSCFKSKEAMDILHEKGYYIIIVSNQPEKYQQSGTLLWLEINDIYYDSICFTEKKELIQGDIIVDDNVDFLERCFNERRVCIKAPYNKDCKFEMYDSLYDFANKI